MKLFKSLLLGSAAGLVAVSGASAADLGVRKPTAAVEYVRVCSAHGAGFFYIPGSDVCMQISGRVRAEYLAATTFNRFDDLSSFRANGRVNVDVRQTTQYGLLRTFVRFDVYSNNGRYGGNFGAPAANFTGAILDKAFIQFYTGTAGFFTAGRSASFFDFYANSENWSALPGSDSGSTNLFAYTFTFGGGLTATLSVEDALSRRTSAGFPGGAFVTYPVGTVIPANSQITFLGQRTPDIVGNVRIDQAWGSAQLSAALHQLQVTNASAVGLFAANGVRNNNYGFAIQGGVKINLPMLAAGDVLWLQAAYSDGAISFTNPAGINSSAQFGSARPLIASTDAFIDVNGRTRRAKSWSMVGAFVHNFTPTIQGIVSGGYGEADYSGSSVFDYRAYAIGGSLSWLPVRNFRIGAEVMYNVVDPRSRIALSSALGPVVSAKGKYDSVTARIRFQRDF